MSPLVVALHLAGALAALWAAVVALRGAPGGRTHRRAGTAYVAGWATLALVGGCIGAGRPGVSPCEVMNAIRRVLVALASAPAIAPRRRPALNLTDGRSWLRRHLPFMVASLPFFVVAGAN